MQLDTFSFSSNFLNMIQGEGGAPSEEPELERFVETPRVRRRRLPEEGRQGRSRRLSLTGRERALRLRVRSTSAPGSATRCCRQFCDRRFASRGVWGVKGAGLEEEEREAGFLSREEKNRRRLLFLLLLLVSRMVVPAVTHAGSRGTGAENWLGEQVRLFCGAQAPRGAQSLSLPRFSLSHTLRLRLAL